MDDDDEGVTSRDVFNEKPLKEDTITAVEVRLANTSLSGR